MEFTSSDDILKHFHTLYGQLYPHKLELKDINKVAQTIATDERFQPLLDELKSAGYTVRGALLAYLIQGSTRTFDETGSGPSEPGMAENEATGEASSSASAEAGGAAQADGRQQEPRSSPIAQTACLHLEFSEKRWKDWLIENEFDKNEDKLKEFLAAYAKHHGEHSREELFANIELEEKPVEKLQLIPDPFICKTRPDCLKIVKTACLRNLDASGVILSFIAITDSAPSASSHPSSHSTSAEELEEARHEAERKQEEIAMRESLRWFGRFLKYKRAEIKGDRKFKPNLGLDGSHIAEAIELLSSKLHGIEEVKRQMSVGFQLFKDTKTLPRGVLLHGPPGTGKTSIVLTLNDLLGIQPVSGMLAAGDFAKPLVGQAEQMIIQLGKRAKTVPWRLCCVVVDEIESLVTKRDGGNGGGGDSSKLSVLLSLIGGVGDVPNLMFFACTNFPEQMDAAFMRRMKIKIFVGPPTRSGRAKFIHKLGAEIFGTKDHRCESNGRFFDKGCMVPGCKLEQAVVDLMLNYAAAQMMGALLRLKIVLGETNKGSMQLNFTDIRDALAQFSDEENILVSTYNTVTILASIVRPSHHSAPSELVSDIQGLESCFSPDSELTDDCSKRVLVDLSISKQQVQIELSRTVRTKAQEAFMTGRTSGRTSGKTYLETLGDIFSSTQRLQETLDALTLAFADNRRTNRLIEPYVKTLEPHLKLHEYNEMCKNPILVDSRKMDALLNVLAQTFDRNKLVQMKEQPLQSIEIFQSLIGSTSPKRCELGRALRNELESRFSENIRREGYKYFDLVRESSDITLEELLAFLFQLGNTSDSSRILLICPEFFHSNGVSNENEMELLFHQQINLLRNSYKSGFVIVDVDALTNPQAPTLGQGQMDNSKLFTTIMAAMHTVPSSGIWFVAFSRNPVIMRRVREYHSWKPVEPDPEGTCLNCGNRLRESQNRSDACGAHSGALLVYDRVSRTYDDHPNVVEEIPVMEHDRRKEIINRVRTGRLNWKLLKWSCCDRALFSSHGGELQSKHVIDTSL